MELTEPHRSLWPDDGQSETAGKFYVLGSSAKAQVLVPARPLSATSRSLVRFHGGMGIGTRSVRRSAAILARLGIFEVMIRDRRFVDLGDIDDPESLRSILSNAVGERDIAVSISFGPPRANQKPIIRIMRRDGRSLGFAKIGWNPLTMQLVEAEIMALATPGLRGLSHVIAPRVLHSGMWKSNRLAVLEALEGRAGILTPTQDAFDEVARIWPRQHQPLGESTFGQHLTSAARTAEIEGTASALRTVERLLGAYRDEQFRFAGWHGDWAPWNNVRFDSGRIALWDWERAGPHVPEGFDSIHYRFQPEWLRNRLPTEALIASSTAALTHLSPARRQALGRLYVATIALRHLQPEATGGPVQRSAQLLADLNQLIEK